MKDDILQNLNKAQQQAVLHESGPLLIIAGAGSGKTRTLTHRIGYLIANGVSPQSIMAVTFTNKAAQEMKERTVELLSSSTDPRITGSVNDLPIGTFHSICVRMLRHHAEHLGYKNNFLIYDRSDQISLVKAIMKDHHIGGPDTKPNSILNEISRAKSALLSPEAYKASVGSGFEEQAAAVYVLYQQQLKENNAMDFDDLIMLTVELFKQKPEILAAYQKRFAHIMVDEYQDTNTAQYEWTQLLAKAHENLCVVGDDWQSIYRFRNADFRNILNFEKDYPTAKVVKLEQNYRSTKTILDAADAVIKKNEFRTDKELWTDKGEGERITLYAAEDELTEAQYVIDTAYDLAKNHGYSRSAIAILYRTNAQSRALEDVLIRDGIPYQLVGAVRFYERREVKDMLAYLRLFDNPEDSHSFKRVINVPPRGIGPKTFEKISPLQSYICTGMLTKDHCTDAGLATKVTENLMMLSGQFKRGLKMLHEMSLPQFINKLINLTKYDSFLIAADDNTEERIENIKELASIASADTERNATETLRDFLTTIMLMSDPDSIKSDEDRLTLMTMHSAKGLEFPVVFIAGMEEGIFPHYRSLLDPHEMEEERRLCYVGITRAKEKLYLSFARRRRLYGRLQANPPSRFLMEIPEHTMQFDEDYV